MRNQEVTTLKKLLRSKGYSVTRQRLALFDVLRKHPALTMKELVEQTSSQDTASTYRNVNLFEQLGIIARIRLGWHTKIELSDMFQEHHHHLTCSGCGTHSDIGKHTQLENYISTIIAKHGYTEATHQLEIFGICSQCKK